MVGNIFFITWFMKNSFKCHFSPDGGELNQEDTGKAGEVTCLLTNKVLLENQDTSVPPIKKHKDVDDLSAKYSRIDRMASRFVF